MVFFESLSKMVVILFGIACGYLANRLGIMGGETDQKCSKLILTITLPAMTVGSVISRDAQTELTQILAMLKVGALFYLLGLVFVLLLPRFLGGTPGQKGVYRFALFFPNVAFIGYPVVKALFGADAFFYAVILALPFNLLSYTLGPLMLVGAKRFHWRQVVTPCTVSSCIALFFALTGLRIPEIVGECLCFVGDATVPLSLLVVGSLLAGLSIGGIFKIPGLWGLAVLRLLVMPAALFFILKALEVESLLLGVAVVQMAMPVAINGSMLCLEYGGDKERMAQATFLTTLLSMATVPLLASVLLL